MVVVHDEQCRFGITNEVVTLQLEPGMSVTAGAKAVDPVVVVAAEPAGVSKCPLGAELVAPVASSLRCDEGAMVMINRYRWFWISYF